MSAAAKGYTSMVEMILRNRRADPMVSINGTSAIHLASFQGHASVLSALIADERVDPNTVGCGLGSFTPTILDAEHAVEQVRGRHLSTPIIIAAVQDHAPVLTVLLADDRVDPNLTDIEGYTALMRGKIISYLRLPLYYPTSGGDPL